MSCLLSIATFAQTNDSTKIVVKPIDPVSIDITKPTLFAVPYTHLDDMWRWSYPQVILEFLKNTLDDNFKAFKEYPGYVFNWSGAYRFETEEMDKLSSYASCLRRMWPKMPV